MVRRTTARKVEGGKASLYKCIRPSAAAQLFAEGLSISLRKAGNRLHAISKPGLCPREIQSLPAPSCIVRSEEAVVVGSVDDTRFAGMSGNTAHRRALRLRQAAHCLLPW